MDEYTPQKEMDAITKPYLNLNKSPSVKATTVSKGRHAVLHFFYIRTFLFSGRMVAEVYSQGLNRQHGGSDCELWERIPILIRKSREYIRGIW